MKGGLSLLLTLMIQMASSAATLVPPAIAPAVLAALGLDTQYVGVYISVVFFAGAISGVYAVSLVRRFGPIRTSQAGLLLSASGLALMSTLNPWLALIGAYLVGTGYGPITPASSDILARTAPPERYALVFSLKQSGVPLGGAVAGLLAPPMVVAAGARAALLEIAALCLVTMAAVQILQARLDANRDPAAPWPTLTAFLRPLRFVIAHPTLRVLCICSFVFSMTQHSLGSFMVSWLNTSLAWTLVAAGVAFSVANTAGIVGRIGWSLIADRTGSSLPILLGLAVLMLVSTSLMIVPDVTTSHWPILLLLALFGASAIGWNGVYLAQVAQEVPKAEAATATAGCLFFTYLGVVFGPPVFGTIARLSDSLGLAYSLLAVPLVLIIILLVRHLRAPAA